MEDEIKSTMSEEKFEDLKKEIQSDTKAVVEDILKSNVSSQRLPMGEEDAKAQAANGKFKSFGDFALAIHDKSTGKNNDTRLKALGENSGETGGFLVPEEFRAQLMQLSLEDAVVRPRATIIPMASNTLKIPTVKDTTHASTVFGGVSAQWVEEAGSYTASEPDFGQMQLNAKKLTGYTQVSDELISDSSIALESLLIGMFGDAISTIVYENIVDMYSRMLPASANNSVWIANPNIMPQLMTMALNVGTGGSAIFVNNASDGVPMTIFGRPVIFTEHCKTLGTVGDIFFADLSYYVIGDRNGVAIASSPHYRFANGETVWRFTERIDGGPWLESAITPENGSTLSPFIALSTRS